ncbi:unnamed protein product [Linum trigynum]|uniref:Retroviral polymerase SH3-like domain-containing protein n=1 Tax=Linum trigynum TaxID=586398 RepID=A0AAV2E3P3_9ROSI
MIYILNRSPTKAVRNKTLIHAWHHSRPQVDHLKVFGCIAYAHISTPNRDKFDQKGEKLIFTSYSDESKGYRLYNLVKNEVVVSQDVIFDEMEEWNWENPISQSLPSYEILEDSAIPEDPSNNPDPIASPEIFFCT